MLKELKHDSKKSNAMNNKRTIFARNMVHTATFHEIVTNTTIAIDTTIVVIDSTMIPMPGIDTLIKTSAMLAAIVTRITQ